MLSPLPPAPASAALFSIQLGAVPYTENQVKHCLPCIDMSGDMITASDKKLRLISHSGKALTMPKVYVLRGSKSSS